MKTLNRTEPGLGHNVQSPINTLRAELEQDNIPLLKRRDDLLAASERMPKEVLDDEEAGRVSDQIKQLKACAKDAESRRVGEKAPHMALAHAVDGFFNGIKLPLAEAAETALTILGVYQRQRESEKRNARIKAEQEATAVAEQKALDITDDVSLEIAVEAAVQQQKAHEAAAVNAAELSRTRGDYGSVASLRTTFDFEVLDISKVPEAYIMVNEKVVRAAIRGKNGLRQIDGLRIFSRKDAVVR